MSDVSTLEAVIEHPAIDLRIDGRHPERPTIHDDGYFEMREWQSNCFGELATSNHWVVNAPMAAGKTFLLCALSADRLRRDPNLRVVIAVPQTIIGAGFRNCKIQYPDGSRFAWDLEEDHDLCRGANLSTTKRLAAFLTGTPAPTVMGRVMLCSHMTMVAAFQSDPEAFRDVLLVIDEAHHVKHSGEEDDTTDNEIGAVVRHALAKPDAHISLGLSTATFFRGDMSVIVPDRNAFDWFEFSFDEYLQTCRYLKGFSYDFMLYAGDYTGALAQQFAKGIGKTIVYIPAVGSYGSLGSKEEDVAGVLRAISGEAEPVIADQDQPVMRVRRGNRWVKVVNLVDTQNRNEKKEAIVSAHDSSTDADIDIIIALGMLREGANWRWANREFIIGRRDSLTDLIQTIGRLFRDVQGKEHVEVRHLLPFAFDHADPASLRENLNSYLKAVLLSMLFENVIDPVVANNAGETGEPGSGGKRINYLKEAIPDEALALQVLTEIMEMTRDTIALDAKFQDIENLREPFLETVTNVLTIHGVMDHHEQIANQLLRLFNRRTVRLQGLNVNNVDKNLLMQRPLDGLLTYASGVCSIDTFRELRSASQAYAFLPFEEAREFARSLGLSSRVDWWSYCKSGERPFNVPTTPYKVYKEQWTSWDDWLGSGWLPFEEARTLARTLGLSGQLDWHKYCKSGEKPFNVPANPPVPYKEQWTNWDDWLGNGWLPFEEARTLVRALGLSSSDDWWKYCKSVDKTFKVPVHPHTVYKEQWTNWGDWLGTGRQIGGWLPFEEARIFVRALGLSSQPDWVRYCRSGEKPFNVPTSPNIVYKEQWINYRDWLGNRWLPFEEARTLVRALRLSGTDDWYKYCKSDERPFNVPTSPHTVYKEQWTNWGDWLATGRPSKQRKAA